MCRICSFFSKGHYLKWLDFFTNQGLVFVNIGLDFCQQIKRADADFTDLREEVKSQESFFLRNRSFVLFGINEKTTTENTSWVSKTFWVSQYFLAELKTQKLFEKAVRLSKTFWLPLIFSIRTQKILRFV